MAREISSSIIAASSAKNATSDSELAARVREIQGLQSQQKGVSVETSETPLDPPLLLAEKCRNSAYFLHAGDNTGSNTW